RQAWANRRTDRLTSSCDRKRKRSRHSLSRGTAGIIERTAAARHPRSLRFHSHFSRISLTPYPIMTLSDDALDQLFRQARTHNGWQPRPVDDALLKQLVELVLLGPTSANSSPARFVFVKTPEGKARLRPALSAGNLEKTMAAPVTAIVGMDMAFYDHLPKLF